MKAIGSPYKRKLNRIKWYPRGFVDSKNIIKNISFNKSLTRNFQIILTSISYIFPIFSHANKRYFIFYLFFTVLSIPVVIFVRLLRPLIHIRFGRIRVCGLGQCSHVPEVYLSRLASGIERDSTKDLFFFEEPPPHNTELGKIIENKLFVYPLVQPFYEANLLLPGWQKHIIKSPPYYSERDLEHSFLKVNPQLRLNRDQEKIAHQKLIKMGLDHKDKFVCIYCRDKGYRMNATSFAYIYDINEYLFIIDKLIEEDYYVIRMGKNVENALNYDHPKVIDYGYLYHDDLMDLWLSANCEFMINPGGGGLTSLPVIFRRPLLCFEYDVFTFWSTAKDSIVSFKRIVKNDKYVTLTEMINSYGHKKIIKPMEEHSQFEPHSQEEILDLVDEMILRLRGTWVSKPNDNILQDRFWTNLKTWEHFGNWHGEKLLCKVGSKYLNNNQSWLLV